MSDKKKILVVDDEAAVRNVTSIFLKKGGYEPLVAATGEEGITYVRNENPDVVLTDYRMPGMDGYQLVERLIFAGYSGKRVLMSGNPRELYENHPEVEGLFDVYFDGFIEKPFTSDQLLVELARVLGEHESQ